MELLIAGKVLGSHNLKGEVKVISDLENINVLVGNKVILELEDSQQKLLTVKKIEHLVGNKWIFSFEEIKNKQDAIEIRNANIKVRRDIVGIGEDEYLISDIIGFKVYDVKGDEYLGEVTEVMDTAAHDIYVIENEDFETMIPDVDVFIKNIDFENRKMLVDTIEGMKEPKVKK
ncbi:ribosome maturation factor RimM [Fusobacterium simiae]|uniref:Ribosome maturation factor RimM n=1 Tax=Fusobacterium simiae TaxID=855 RepID=A0ABT4DFW7_FUSSI|nr:ribosome maturation factor RimM [Fusobacterium simiae]MCY7007484.1 ribosome maturation factor RimM [Fusobacterium simiae]